MGKYEELIRRYGIPAKVYLDDGEAQKAPPEGRLKPHHPLYKRLEREGRMDVIEQLDPPRDYGLPERVWIDSGETCLSMRNCQFLMSAAWKKAASWLGKTRFSSWSAAVRSWVKKW